MRTTRKLSPRDLARRAYRVLFGVPPPDPVPAWRGTARSGVPTLRVLHVGDCGLRQMEAGHDFRAPLGFPRAAAERLLEKGIGVEFSHYFAVVFEHLPTLELLRRRSRLSGDPDLVVVQLGATYARRVILPDTKLVMRLHVDVARRLGRRVYGGYRVLRPLVRLLGRHATPYPGTAALERFLDAVTHAWPRARVLVIHPFPRVYPYPTQVPIAERTRADIHAAAERCGVEELDLADLLGRDPELRGANGYNLNARGAEVVGEALAERIAERPVVQSGAVAAALAR